MTRPHLLMIAFSLVAAVACSSNGSAPVTAPSTSAATTTAPTSTPTPTCSLPAAQASARPPSDVPRPDGTVWYQKRRGGATTQYFGYLTGADVRVVRDRIVVLFRRANYEIEGRDQEDNVEAEAEFRGAHEGTVQVRHLLVCNSKVRIRFELHS